MPRRKVHAEGTYAHYVTFSCFKRRKLLDPDICKRIVLGQLVTQLARHRAICTGYVVMLEHVHALIWFPEENKISSFMDKWKELTSKEIGFAYAKHFPEYKATWSAGDPVWIPKYYGYNIFTDAKLREKLNYMHNNPVRAGLVVDPCDWKWSSARFWLQGKGGGVPLSWPP